MRLVYLALGWSAGIFISASLPLITVYGWTSLALIGLACVILAWFTPLRWLALGLVCVGLGALRHEVFPKTNSVAFFNDQSVAIEGIVVSAPDQRDEFVQVRIEAQRLFDAREWHPVQGIVLVNLPPQTQVIYGFRVRVGGQMFTPSEGDTFSYADFLARQEVFSVFPRATYTFLEDTNPYPIMREIIALRQRSQTLINAQLPEPMAGLLVGILLGNERGMTDELSDAFSATGTAHVVAISGFNMAIVSGVLMGVFSRLFPRREVVGVVLSIVVLVIYTILVGANAAVVRSAIMSSLLLIAPLLKRKAYLPASLAFVAVAMSFLNPSVLWDVSFQLSFCAILGMMLFVTPISQFLERMLGFRSGFLNDALVVTLAAQIATAPLIVLYFQRFSVVALLTNFLVIPVQTFVLIGGGLAMMIGLFLPTLSQGLFWLVMIGLAWTIGIVRTFAQLPMAEFSLYADPKFVGAFYVLLIGGALMTASRPYWMSRLYSLLLRRVVWVTLMLGAFGLGILVWGMWRSLPDGKFHVWWLDMGHSNAVLMQTPNGAQILIDGGRYPSRLLTALGDRMPFYDRDIEILILTHPDDNDNSALTSVLSRYNALSLISNGQPQLGEVQGELRRMLTNAPHVIATAGYTIETTDGVLIEVLHPQATPELGDPLGDGALLLRVSYGQHSFLLTSDLTRTGQARVLEAEGDIVASVMQLPDHATARSLDGDFLASAQPQVVVLQGDIANRRKDPDEGVLFLAKDAMLLRTDENGTLHLFSDGESLWGVYE